MKRIIKSIILLACVLSAGTVAAQVPGTPYLVTALPANVCQGSSTKGTNFWVSFGGNLTYTSTQVLLQLKISADQSANVTLTFTATGGTYTFTEGGGALTTIDLSSVPGLGDMRNNVYLYKAVTGVYNNTLHITSSTPVSVYAINVGYQSNDATCVLPVDAWGSDYYRLSYPPIIADNCYDIEMIIANWDNTSIFLNSTTLATINQGQVYVVNSPTDMTGRHITTDKPVAYFTHTMASGVPYNKGFADNLFEQMMSVDRWGNRFLVPSAPGDVGYQNNHIRIIASQNGTTVSYSGATFYSVTGGPASFSSGAALNSGQWVELEMNGTGASTSCYINASKPVGVAAYMTGAGLSTNMGDPSIAWIPPLNQSLQSAIISPFMFPSGATVTAFGNLTKSQHYMLLITQTDKKDQTAMNGASLSGLSGFSGWTDNAASGYSSSIYYFDNIADIDKIFTVTNPAGILVLCGGIAVAESYYYNAGSGACIIN